MFQLTVLTKLETVTVVYPGHTRHGGIWLYKVNGRISNWIISNTFQKLAQRPINPVLIILSHDQNGGNIYLVIFANEVIEKIGWEKICAKATHILDIHVMSSEPDPGKVKKLDLPGHYYLYFELNEPAVNFGILSERVQSLLNDE